MTFRFGQGAGRLFAVVLAVFLATPAAAQPEGALGPFLGYWYGTTDPGNAETRDISVLIRSAEDGGFRVDWDNYTVIDEPASDGAIEFRENELEFQPSQQEDGLWQAQRNGDTYQAWAVVDDNVLTVTIEATDPAGRAERQVYRRIVSGSQMQLFYQRLLDGEIDRELSGSLTLVYEEGSASTQ